MRHRDFLTALEREIRVASVVKDNDDDVRAGPDASDLSDARNGGCCPQRESENKTGSCVFEHLCLTLLGSLNFFHFANGRGNSISTTCLAFSKGIHGVAT